jgi:hypothetical protein
MKPARALVIVCAYPDGRLPSGWFQAIQRARRKSDRAGIGVRLELLPVSRIPPGAEIIVAAEPLPPSDRPESEVVIVEPGAVGATIDGLIARLVAEQRAQPGSPASRAVAVHRGFQPLSERARIAD